MKLRSIGALALAFVPLACSLAVDTDGFTNGTSVGTEGGASSSGSADGGPSSTVDGSGNPSGDASDAHDSEPSKDAASGRFCDQIKPSYKLQFCDDFDDPARTSLFAGWTLLQGGGAGEKTGLSIEGEPVSSAPRSARIVQDPATGHARTRIARPVLQGKDFRLHLKYFRTSQVDSAAIATLQGASCAVLITPSELVSYCPSYAVIYDLPDAPENTWNEMTITIEEHGETSRFFITAPSVSDQRVDLSTLIKIDSLELGQGAKDGQQTVFLDDVWAESDD